jgi:uncharacterized membrane protein
MAIGPVQLLVIGFAGGEFKGEILEELDRLKDNDIIRLIDMTFVRKDESGELMIYERSDLSTEEAAEFGATVGALIGLGAGGEEGATIGAVRGAEAFADREGVLDEAQTWYVADAIPEGTAAAIALIEHRWALPLRGAIFRAGGFHLADAWIHPADLVAIGLAAADEAPAL